MSYDAVQAVLERTVTDPTFRAQLFNDPDQALADYALTNDESAALHTLSIDASHSESSELDQRETKKVLPFWLTGGL